MANVYSAILAGAGGHIGQRVQGRNGGAYLGGVAGPERTLARAHVLAQGFTDQPAAAAVLRLRDLIDLG